MATCPTCADPLEPGQHVCHGCGSLRPDAVPTREDERAVLVELRQAMAAAIADAERQGQAANPVRDRFLKNALVPADPGLLIEEAVYCQTFFLDTVDADTTIPQARFRACLTRLEVEAVDDPALRPKVDVLRGQLEQHRKQALRNNLVMLAAVTGALIVLVAGVAGLIALIGRLFS
jgi:hypothetical protein